MIFDPDSPGQTRTVGNYAPWSFEKVIPILSNLNLTTPLSVSLWYEIYTLSKVIVEFVFFIKETDWNPSAKFAEGVIVYV